MYEALLKNLSGRRFTAHLAKTADEAKAIALDLIGERSVGIGGSRTVKQLGLYEALTTRGNEVHWHWVVDAAHKKEERDLAVGCQVYMLSLIHI